MSKRASKSTIEILDEESVRGVFFRVAEMENGVFKRSLPCRCVLTDDGWKVSFYGPHDLRGAERGAKPLTEIPVHLMPLVKVALDRADEIESEWLENMLIF